MGNELGRKGVTASKSTNYLNLGNITQKWVDLLLPFSEDYAVRMTESELARKARIAQQSASRHLAKLVSLNLIRYERQGRNKVFYLDLELHTARILLTLIEARKSLNFCLAHTEISTIIGELLQDCEGLILFGSYAAGNFGQESDLDLIILGKAKRLAVQKIKQRRAIEINEHYSGYDEFAKKLQSRNPLALEVMKNRILFGNISKIVDIFLRLAHERR
ncbi:nucleotidyltransferase domain-containing protein [Candidatus Woesearchaeota archaeon]|nr:nucleotidyltransferase domain-containing protein [Candidatus Woesearchaeota archaeon]